MPVGPKWPCGANTAFASDPAQANTTCHHTGAYCPSAPRGRAGPIRLSHFQCRCKPIRLAIARAHIARRPQVAVRGQYGPRKCSGTGQYGLSSDGRILSVGPTWPCGANTAFAVVRAQSAQANGCSWAQSAFNAAAGQCGLLSHGRILPVGPKWPRGANTALACARAHSAPALGGSGAGQYGLASFVRILSVGPEWPRAANTAASQRGRSLRVIASPSRQRQAQRRLSLVLCARNATLRDGRRRAGDHSRFSRARRGDGRAGGRLVRLGRSGAGSREHHCALRAGRGQV